MVHVAALLVGLALAGAVPDATPSPRFERCFAAARQALTDGAASPARTGFQACLDVATPGPERWRALLGLALARHATGDLPLALATYQRFLTESADVDDAVWRDRRRDVVTEVATLRARVLETHAEVLVRSATPGAEVALAGVDPAEVQRAPPSYLYLEPGRHVLTVRASDHEPLDVPLEVAAGDAVAVGGDLAPSAPPPPASPPTELAAGGPPEPPEADPIVRRALPELQPDVDYTPHALIGGGVAVVAAGVVFTALALGDADRLETLQGEPLTDDVRAEDARLRARVGDYEVASWILYGVGGAALVAGVVLAVSGGDDDAPGASAVDLVTVPGGAVGRVRVGF